MAKEPKTLLRHEWAEREDVWQGEFEGRVFGTGASVMFFTTDKVGHGPKLHRHPYDEIFIVRLGRARFTVGERTIEAGEGQIVFGPACVPHAYENLGPGRLEMTDIHVTDRFEQEDLA
nr:cupin domain-containing protein [uncultured Gellertiella sp.]